MNTMQMENGIMNTTREDKELLLKYLCTALSYKIIIDYSYNGFKIHKGNYVSCIKQGSKCLLDCDLLDVFMSPRQNEEGEYIKPYLRPLSSMTEKEVEEFVNLQEDFFKYCKNQYVGVLTIAALDWLNTHHFDYRNLIEKGLALEAPEGMYYE